MELPRRPRRLRQNATVRNLVRETRVCAHDLIQPVFIMEGAEGREPIASMPDIYRHGMHSMLDHARELWDNGIQSVALFPSVDISLKDAQGSEALDPNNLVARSVRALRKAVPDLNLIADVALDPYTSHGHDGLLSEDGTCVDNDASVEVLEQMALVLAEAGVDWVAPSDMMDGRIGAIRNALDGHGFTDACILAYSAKFASAYYGPFRDAIGSSSSAGTRHLDKQTYQMDPANRREAMLEAALDIEEGADAIMVKPAGPYLDIIRDLREQTTLPLAAYQVSGEYAQLHAAAQKGWLDLRRCRDESLLCIKRAGADLILSYFSAAFVKDSC